MIQVSKEDMKKLRSRFKDIQATRTVNKYYIEERPKYVEFLKNGSGRPVKKENRHA